MGAIYLVRHGQASFGAADYDKLSGLGAEQGAVVGEELRRRELRLAVVRSGSMVRQ
ncbi:MAG: histidine phosphatase family protein, partial [Thermocrispum sp.]